MLAMKATTASPTFSPVLVHRKLPQPQEAVRQATK
jgi:hypothetical protein